VSITSEEAAKGWKEPGIKSWETQEVVGGRILLVDGFVGRVIGLHHPDCRLSVYADNGQSRTVAVSFDGSYQIRLDETVKGIIPSKPKTWTGSEACAVPWGPPQRDWNEILHIYTPGCIPRDWQIDHGTRR